MSDASGPIRVVVRPAEFFVRAGPLKSAIATVAHLPAVTPARALTGGHETDGRPGAGATS